MCDTATQVRILSYFDFFIITFIIKKININQDKSIQMHDKIVNCRYDDAYVYNEWGNNAFWT